MLYGSHGHGGSYCFRYAAYHAQYMAWATEWASALRSGGLDTLNLSYEPLSGFSD